MSGVRRIFERMCIVLAIFKWIPLHAFRHYFNHALSVSIDTLNAHGERSAIARVTAARELDIRSHLDGYRGRASGQFYKRRHIREISEIAARQIQTGVSRKDEEKGGADEVR